HETGHALAYTIVGVTDIEVVIRYLFQNKSR
ncbi:unnamed protein product, partial [marine sediment metagenome]